MRFIVVLAALCAVAVNATYDQATVDRFAAWQRQYGRVYASEAEYNKAIDNFVAFVAHAEEMAKEHPEATFGPNQFADQSLAELKEKYLNARAPTREQVGHFAVARPVPEGTDVPATFDWRTKGAVTPVRDQGSCGSCWAFSTTENVESMTFLAGHPLQVLSPQQLVDCDPVSQGCGGGWTMWAMEYLTTAGGQTTEQKYPYTGEDGNCKFTASEAVTKLNNFTFAVTPCLEGTCKTQNETALQAQIATTGPMAICVDAESWFSYSSGILSGKCPSAHADIDHCVQLVGYDWNNSYWIVRNSWASSWGEQGFIRIKTGSNMCGLADVPLYANII